MRILCLDLGEKRIGVAVSDPLGITAQGLETIQRKTLQQDIESLKHIVEKFKPGKIIIGLPVNMNGTKGKQAQKAINFSQEVKKHFNILVELWDERLSTVQAHRFFSEAQIHWKKRRVSSDRVAAQIILRGYLDSVA
jgi:putative Holliday junction resolvase